ncbi:MAG: hypothetical protein ACT4NY_27520 [Pseudonocardiales bacterium]
MWPWQRTQRADHPRADHPTGSVTAEVLSRSVVARRPEWTALPPIQRAIDTLRPVAPQQEFRDSLVSWRNPSFLAPLGHLVSAHAPAGVIHRLIEPAAPPSDHPTTPPLTLATAPPRPPRASLVQRILAAFSPSPPPTLPPSPADPHPPPNSPHQDAQNHNPAPNSPLGYPVDRNSAPNSGLEGAQNRDSAPNSARQGRAVVQRSGGAALSLTQAPAPVLSVLELPVVAGQSVVAEPAVAEGSAQTAEGHEQHAARDELPSRSDLLPPGDSAGGKVPTLGAGPALPFVARTVVDRAASEAAEVSGQERPAVGPVAEISGGPGPQAPLAPLVARDAVADAVSPSVSRPADVLLPPDASVPLGAGDVSEVPTLGAGPAPPIVARTVVEGGVSESAEVSGQQKPAAGPVAEISGGPAPQAPVVVQDAVTDAVSLPASMPAIGLPPLAAPPPLGGGEVDAAPTLGAGPALPTVARSVADDAAPGNPMVARVEVPPGVPAPPGSAGGAGTSRRLGLGPPLAPDAVTAQRSRAVPPGSAISPGSAMSSGSATSLPQPPWVAVPQFHVRSVGGSQIEGAEVVEGTVQSPPFASAKIAPPLSESGSVAVPDDAVTSPERPLPVLRVHDAAVSPADQSSADQLGRPADTSPLTTTTEAASFDAAVSAPPVVARLVGDRALPLLTVPSPTHGPTGRGWAPEQSGGAVTSGGAPSVQLTPVESPIRSGGHDHGTGHADEQLTPIGVTSAALGAPLRAAGYPHATPVTLMPVERSAQLTPVGHAVQRSAQLTAPGQLPTVVQAAPRHAQVAPMAPVVHAVPPEPASAQIVQREAIVTPDVALAPDVAPAPSVQPVPSVEPVPDVAPEAGAELPGVPGQASAAGAGGVPAAGSPEEMAKKLFDPLLRRLKTELRLDRERRGTLTDLRH